MEMAPLGNVQGNGQAAPVAGFRHLGGTGGWPWQIRAVSGRCEARPHFGCIGRVHYQKGSCKVSTNDYSVDYRRPDVGRLSDLGLAGHSAMI